jgi:large subunit ribosomal protein L25
MEKIVLEAKKRKEVGKLVKMVRRDGFIPAIVYGYKQEPMPISLEKRSSTLILNKVSGSTMLTLNIEGKEYSTLVRDVQRDHLRNEFLHLDFLVVSLTEKLRTAVSITLVGDAAVLEEYEALIVAGITEVEVEALPQDLPETIEVDVSGLAEIGQAIYLKDVPAPANVEILTDPEELIAVASAVKEEAVEEEVEAVLEGEEGAEPEVIEHGKGEETEEAE